jgi:serine protease Do
MSAKKKTSIALFIVVAFLTGVLFTTAGANIFDLGDRFSQNSRAGTTRLAQSPADLQSAFTEVAKSVNPTVVQIQAEKAVQQQQRNPFEEFFGGPQRQGPSPLRQGIGSGVVVREDGYIVTNNHVVQDAEELTVVMYDGTQHEAEIVGTDPQSDLAVVRVEATGLPAVSYGDSDDTQVGEWVMAFGSPLSADLENTVTAGIISAKGRVSGTTTRLNAIAEFIQTDAAINPGNSGGPLVNLQGELVGINSAIASQTGGYQGIGFTIPVNLVKSVTDQLIESGSVARAFLGVGFGNVPPAVAHNLDVPRGAAQVTSVTSGSAAARAGLRTTDIITAVDGQTLSNFNQLRTTIGSKRPGDDVELTVVSGRNGDRRTLDVELGEREQQQIFSNDSGSGNQGNTPGRSGEERLGDLGLSLQSVTPRLLQQQRLPSREEYQGVLVTNVEARSYAYREAELRRGAIITHVNDERVRSVQEFAAAYEDVEAGSSFRVRLLRTGRGPNGDVQTSETATFLSKPSN